MKEIRVECLTSEYVFAAFQYKVTKFSNFVKIFVKECKILSFIKIYWTIKWKLIRTFEEDKSIEFGIRRWFCYFLALGKEIFKFYFVKEYKFKFYFVKEYKWLSFMKIYRRIKWKFIRRFEKDVWYEKKIRIECLRNESSWEDLKKIRVFDMGRRLEQLIWKIWKRLRCLIR